MRVVVSKSLEEREKEKKRERERERRGCVWRSETQSVQPWHLTSG